MADPRYNYSYYWPNSTDKLTVNCDKIGDDEIKITSDINTESSAREMTIKLTSAQGLTSNIVIKLDASEWLLDESGGLPNDDSTVYYQRWYKPNYNYTISNPKSSTYSWTEDNSGTYSSYTPQNLGVDSSVALIRFTWTGTSLTFNINVVSENACDGLVIGNIDLAFTDDEIRSFEENGISSEYNNANGYNLYHDSQSGSETISSSTSGEHFVEFIYCKDDSYSEDDETATVTLLVNKYATGASAEKKGAELTYKYIDTEDYIVDTNAIYASTKKVYYSPDTTVQFTTSVTSTRIIESSEYTSNEVTNPFWVTASNNTDTVVLNLTKSSSTATYNAGTNNIGITGDTWIPVDLINHKVTIKPTAKVYITGTYSSGLSSSATVYKTLSSNGTKTKVGGCLATFTQESYYTPNAGSTPACASYCYSNFFRGQPIVDAYTLDIGYSTLTGSYYQAFYNCTSMTRGPRYLRPSALGNYVYYEMFRGCTSMENTPQILALVAYSSSCTGMYYGCTKITYLYLPATTANYSYTNLAYGCSNLSLVINLCTTSPSYSNWLSGVSSTGTYWGVCTATTSNRSASTVPSSWTIKSDPPFGLGDIYLDVFPDSTTTSTSSVLLEGDTLEEAWNNALAAGLQDSKCYSGVYTSYYNQLVYSNIRYLYDYPIYSKIALGLNLYTADILTILILLQCWSMEDWVLNQSAGTKMNDLYYEDWYSNRYTVNTFDDDYDYPWAESTDSDGYTVFTSSTSESDDGEDMYSPIYTKIRITWKNQTSVTFKIHTSTEEDYDLLGVSAIDTVLPDSAEYDEIQNDYTNWSGDTDTTYSISCDTNEHFVEFCYVKDDGSYEGDDQVSVTPMIVRTIHKTGSLLNNAYISDATSAYQINDEGIHIELKHKWYTPDGVARYTTSDSVYALCETTQTQEYYEPFNIYKVELSEEVAFKFTNVGTVPSGAMYLSIDGTNWYNANGLIRGIIYLLKELSGPLYITGQFSSGISSSSSRYVYVASSNSKLFGVSGNLVTLISRNSMVTTSGSDVSSTLTALPSAASYSFYKFFYNCTALKFSYSLRLGTGSAGTYAYYEMFRGCSNLVSGPQYLSPTTISVLAYNGMFRDCTSMINTPLIIVRNVPAYGCAYMFYGCTSITDAYVPINTLLLSTGIQYMFYGCTALATVYWEYDGTTVSTSTFLNVSSSGTWYGDTTMMPSGWTSDNWDRQMVYPYERYEMLGESELYNLYDYEDEDGTIKTRSFGTIDKTKADYALNMELSDDELGYINAPFRNRHIKPGSTTLLSVPTKGTLLSYYKFCNAVVNTFMNFINNAIIRHFYDPISIPDTVPIHISKLIVNNTIGTGFAPTNSVVQKISYVTSGDSIDYYMSDLTTVTKSLPFTTTMTDISGRTLPSTNSTKNFTGNEASYIIITSNFDGEPDSATHCYIDVSGSSTYGDKTVYFITTGAAGNDEVQRNSASYDSETNRYVFDFNTAVLADDCANYVYEGKPIELGTITINIKWKNTNS